MTDPEHWRPFGLSDEEAIDFDVLRPGVPDWMRNSLLQWIGDCWKDSRDTTWIQKRPVMEAEVALRLDLGSERNTVGSYWVKRMGLDAHVGGFVPEVQLRLVDYILSTRVTTSLEDALDDLLASSKSKWMVGVRMGKHGLVERVPEGVQASVEHTIATAGEAGRLLARAWAKVHGITADDPGGYADAVRAAEIAAITVVQPTHATATLGSVIGQMEADADWRLPLREHGKAAAPEMILMMLRTLWYGHRDRHGSVTYTDVTHEEARAAVVLAATVIDWFASGAIARG